MNLQPATRREIKRISAGVLIGSVLMVLVFVLLGKFDWTVLWGALLGDAVAIGNFVYLGLSVQKAAAADDPNRARLTIRASYSIRMLVAIMAVVVGLAVDALHWAAVVIPLLLPRLTILALQISGAYKPENSAPRQEEKGE